MILHLEDIATFVNNHIIPLCKSNHIITLTGPLGAGKTTLIRETLKQLGVEKTITSPTFGYVKTYQTPNKTSIHHFDLYRISSQEDFVAAGLDEYLTQSNNISFIEWPEVISQLIATLNKTSRVAHLCIDYHATDQKIRSVKIISNQT